MCERSLRFAKHERCFARRRTVEMCLDSRLDTLTRAGLPVSAFPPVEAATEFVSESKVPSSASALQAEAVSPQCFSAKNGSGPSSVVCGVCLEDVPSASAFGLWCGHLFCTGCWQSMVALFGGNAGSRIGSLFVLPTVYVEDMVGQKEACMQKTCMAPKCGAAVTSEAVAAIAGA